MLEVLIQKQIYSKKSAHPSDFSRSLRNPTIVGAPGQLYLSRIFISHQNSTIHLLYINHSNPELWLKAGVLYY
jgi:hypothetical protein